MDFVKMHGAGNDYVYVDVTKTPPPPKLPELARAISDRRTGVGSDGLILIAPSDRGDFRMIMYNADGSEGEMCGNGIRCIGKYVYEHGLTSKKNLEIETKGGKVLLDLHTEHGQVYAVTVAMGAPRPVPGSFHVKADGTAPFVPVEVRAGDRAFAATVVSMGNPHCVVEVPEVDGFPVEQIGPLIEKHPDFPSRVNVEFVKILSRQRVRQRTWERGSGETLACGSGACAVVAALHHADRVADHVAVELLGGTLAIRLTRDGDVFLSGPAVEVFSGRWPT
jgi:diaminopimelate epimerase